MKVSRKTRKAPTRLLQAKAYTVARAAVFERSEGRCEYPGCGRAMSLDGMNAHHRRLRSAGGSDCACNLMALCPFCHHGKVHHHPLDAKDHGWIVSRFDKRPSSQVGMLLAGGMRFFTCTGRTSGDPTPSLCSMDLHATVDGETLR